MAKLQKYLFDVDFGAPPKPAAEMSNLGLMSDDEMMMMGDEIEPEEEAPPPPPTFSEEELQLAREQAYEAGRAAGINEAETATERMQASALQTMAYYLQQIGPAQAADNDQRLRDCVTVAVGVVKKIHPEMSRVHGLDEIEGLIRECLAQLDKDVRVTIRVNPALMENVRLLAESAAQAAAFDGKLLFAADPRVTPGDCKVEWGDGGAERDQARIWAEIDNILARALGMGEHAAEHAATAVG